MYNYANCNLNDYTLPEAGQNWQPPSTMPSYNANIISSYEGFIRGNMFNNLYQPYVAGEPFPLNPQNEREDLLNKVREANFAELDLGLYLDTHPDDAETLNVFNRYRMQGNQLVNDYEGRYGPLTLRSDALNAYPWAWIKSPWPWEVR